MPVSPMTESRAELTERMPRRIRDADTSSRPCTTPAPTDSRDRAALTSEELRELRTSLLQFRKDRLGQLDALDARPARGDVVGLAYRSTVRQLLHDIEAALGRLDAGTYGRCQHCTAPMQLDRLMQLPYAKGCDECVRLAAGW